MAEVTGNTRRALWLAALLVLALGSWAFLRSEDAVHTPEDTASPRGSSTSPAGHSAEPNREKASRQRTPTMNHKLRDELEHLRDADQKLRVEAMAIAGKHGRDSPEYQTFREKGLEQEKGHIARLVEIVEKYGWPGTSLVGEKAASGAFLVLQHADVELQKRFLPLMRASTEAEDIPSEWLPLLEDRVLLYEGKKQIYGTQITRSPAGTPELWPIADEEHLDERRARVGLEPIADYLKRFGLEYSPKKQ